MIEPFGAVTPRRGPLGRRAVAPGGRPVRQQTARGRQPGRWVTNLETGKSLTYNVSGPGTFWQNPTAGTFGAQLYGPNLLWTAPENLPDEPTGVPP